MMQNDQIVGHRGVSVTAKSYRYWEGVRSSCGSFRKYTKCALPSSGIRLSRRGVMGFGGGDFFPTPTGAPVSCRVVQGTVEATANTFGVSAMRPERLEVVAISDDKQVDIGSAVGDVSADGFEDFVIAEDEKVPIRVLSGSAISATAEQPDRLYVAAETDQVVNERFDGAR